MFSFLSNLWDLLFPKAWYIDGTKFIRASNSIIREGLLLLIRGQELNCKILAYKWQTALDDDCNKPNLISKTIKSYLLTAFKRALIDDESECVVLVIGNYRKILKDSHQRCIIIKPANHKPIIFIGSKDSLYQALDKIPELSGVKNIIETYSEYIEEA